MAKYNATTRTWTVKRLNGHRSITQSDTITLTRQLFAFRASDALKRDALVVGFIPVYDVAAVQRPCGGTQQFTADA